MQRRDFLRAFAALTEGVCRCLICAPLPAATATLSPLGKPQTFDYAWLKGHARALANGVYQTPASHVPDGVKTLDWDQYQAIRYRPEQALWALGPPALPGEVLSSGPLLHRGLFGCMRWWTASRRNWLTMPRCSIMARAA